RSYDRRHVRAGRMSSRSVGSGQVARRRRTRASAPRPKVRAARPMISPEKSDTLLEPAGLVGATATRGPAAGRLRSAARVFAGALSRRAWCSAPPNLPPDAPLEGFPAPPIRLSTEAGSVPPRLGPPDCALCPPRGEGTTSQYWLIALTVGFEQGAPGWPAAAAGTSGMSSAAPAQRQTVTCLNFTSTRCPRC